MTFELLDHTADLGIALTAPNIHDLFLQAAQSMCRLIAAAETLRPQFRRHLTLAGEDWEELMMNWLRELLYLWHRDKLLPVRIRMDQLHPFALTAHLEMDRFDPARHSLEHDLKAVTWHQFQVVQLKSDWYCRIIFDV